VQGVQDQIPTSLSLRIRGILPIKTRAGAKPMYLTHGMELGVIEFVEFRASRGMCIAAPALRYILRDAAIAGGRTVPSSFPDRHWVSQFMARHPDVSWRRSQLLDVARYRGSSLKVVQLCYDNLAAIMAAYPADRV